MDDASDIRRLLQMRLVEEGNTIPPEFPAEVAQLEDDVLASAGPDIAVSGGSTER